MVRPTVAGEHGVIPRGPRCPGARPANEPPAHVYRMPTICRPLRALAAACLLAATVATAVSGPAAALEPPRPLPGYRPAFVTETDTNPWTDCLWASGAMLLDKWTAGATTITRQDLRALSSVPTGGASLDDLHDAYAQLGIDLEFSPDGGTTIGWPQLLDRLEHGAGAVLLGHDSKLPRWYGRWDVSFWKGLRKNDDHAVYIERYDRAHDRVWLMDPLGSGDWQGEWISVRALRPFAWTTRGGALSVAVSPAAVTAPYAGVTLAATSPVVTATTLDVTWRLKAPRAWSFPGADVKAAVRAGGGSAGGRGHRSGRAGRRRACKRTRAGGGRALQPGGPGGCPAAGDAGRLRGDGDPHGSQVRRHRRQGGRDRRVRARPAARHAPPAPARDGPHRRRHRPRVGVRGEHRRRDVGRRRSTGGRADRDRGDPQHARGGPVDSARRPGDHGRGRPRHRGTRRPPRQRRPSSSRIR